MTTTRWTGRRVVCGIAHIGVSLSLALLWIFILHVVDIPDEATKYQVQLIGDKAVFDVSISVNKEPFVKAKFVDLDNLRVFYFESLFSGVYASGPDSDLFEFDIYTDGGNYKREVMLRGESPTYTGLCLYMFKIEDDRRLTASHCSVIPTTDR